MPRYRSSLFIDTRYQEMREQYEAFDEEHPFVWRLFRRFTLQLIGRGFKRYSADAVFHRIRWTTDQADVDGRSTFKINNNYVAFYTRRFIRQYPEHKLFFRVRRQTSRSGTATNLPELGPMNFPEERRRE